METKKDRLPLSHDESNVSTFTPLCSSQYMSGSLGSLSREQVRSWFEMIKMVDDIIYPIVELCTDRCVKNKSLLPNDIVEKLHDLLRVLAPDLSYDLRNIQIFHGYIFYTNPDHGELIRRTGNPDLYYGIARASEIGAPHRHAESNAFNFILEGEGIFLGDLQDTNRYKKNYHGISLQPDLELEIPVDMTHGHLVKKGSVIWFFALQECGFGPKKSCEGDFILRQDYDIAQFGDEYF
jgi:hypothetical protein